MKLTEALKNVDHFIVFNFQVAGISKKKVVEMETEEISFPLGMHNFNLSEMLIFVIIFPKPLISK